jgi:peptide/nickel transport system substrate-binding protein
VIIAWHVTIAPTWFDPSTAPPQITPFGMLYALHDALVRPLPGQKMAASLAESWKESPDGLTYEFKLRRGLKFHNGDPVTAEDAKFSYERYKGAGAKELQARIQSVDVIDPLTIRFRLKEPWPDFMTFYGTTATAAGLVVPKKYVTQVGDEGFRKHPIGAGPYRFVSHQPGVEVVLEANPAYWRHAPYVKRLVMKSVPEGTSRVAMLKNGEADIAYALDGEDALNVKRDPRLQLVPSKHASIYWIEFPEQWDAKSPWHDKRLRLAVNYSLDRKAINEAACLGFCPPTSVIVPASWSRRPAGAGPTIPKGQEIAGRGGLPQGSTRASPRPSPRSHRGRGRLNFERGASGPRCGPWSARPSTRRGARRSCAGSSWPRRVTRATRPVASNPSSPPPGPTRTAAIPTSTTSSSSSRASATSRSARPSSCASSS